MLVYVHFIALVTFTDWVVPGVGLNINLNLSQRPSEINTCAAEHNLPSLAR